MYKPALPPKLAELSFCTNILERLASLERLRRRLTKRIVVVVMAVVVTTTRTTAAAAAASSRRQPLLPW